MAQWDRMSQGVARGHNRINKMFVFLEKYWRVSAIMDSETIQMKRSEKGKITHWLKWSQFRDSSKPQSGTSGLESY